MIDFVGVSAGCSVHSIPGTIVKSHPKSMFKTAHINSSQTSDFMRDDGVIILQIMQCQDGAVIIEFIHSIDYKQET